MMHLDYLFHFMGLDDYLLYLSVIFLFRAHLMYVGGKFLRSFAVQMLQLFMTSENLGEEDEAKVYIKRMWVYEKE